MSEPGRRINRRFPYAGRSILAWISRTCSRISSGRASALAGACTLRLPSQRASRWPRSRQTLLDERRARAGGGGADCVRCRQAGARPRCWAMASTRRHRERGSVIRSLGHPYRRIGGMKLMHCKYIVRDAGTPDAAVWTGSTNFTDDSWTLHGINNIVRIHQPAIAMDYARDFWQQPNTGVLDGTVGTFDTSPHGVKLEGRTVPVRAMFRPGRGHEIDGEVARLVSSATRRVRICSMLLNSGTPPRGPLGSTSTPETVTVDGVYDRTQMEGVLGQWAMDPEYPNHWKIPAVREVVATRSPGRQAVSALPPRHAARFHAQQSDHRRRHSHHRLV